MHLHPDIPYEVTDFAVAPDTKLVMALGKEAMAFLKEQGSVPKNLGINSLRNKVFTFQGVPTLLSYEHDIADIDDGMYTDLLTDMGGAVRFYRTGKLGPIYGKDYKYVPDFSQTIADIKAEYAKTGVAIDCIPDLETVGLDPLLQPTLTHPGAYIVAMSVTFREGRSDVVYFHSPQEEQAFLWNPETRAQLEWLFTSPMVRIKGSNLAFDWDYFWVRAKITCTNFCFDTTMVGSLLDENRSNSLDVHTKIYAPEMGGYADHFNQTVDKSLMHLVPKDKMLLYVGGDTDASFRVAQKLKPEIIQYPALTNFYINILHPASRAFEAVKRGGVYVDKEKYDCLGADLLAEIGSAQTIAKRILGGRIVAKHYDPDMPGGINLTKKSLLVDFLFTPMGLNLKPRVFTANGSPSTSEETLSQYANHPEAKEFIEALSTYSKASKSYNTHYLGFMEHLRSDGRFHPTYWLFAGDKKRDDGGTVTGRLSAKNPAFQVIPKHTKWGKRIRECFVAPPGMLVMERDYSQGELKLVACIAHEPTMIAAYRNGRDLHVETAGPFRGYDYDGMMVLQKTNQEEFDEIRQLGKAGNFGLVYGMQAPGFQEYAAVNYGVSMPMAKAVEFRESFFARYSILPVYHDTFIEHARRYGFVSSPLGRIRHLPLIKSHIQDIRSKAERQAINSPVQSSLSDMLLWVMALEDKEGLTTTDPAFGSIHDAVYNYVPEDSYEKTTPRHMEIMENLPFHEVGWNPELQFTADVKIGPSMGNLKKYKLTA